MAQDDIGSRKKAWKAFQANYDYVFGLSDRVCSYCLTDQHVAALLSMTEFLKWPTRWVSEVDDIDAQTIRNFASDMEYRLMSGCCDDNLPIQYRYTIDGVLQRSLNGGGTWEDCPMYDPRVYSPQFPPITGDDGDDKKCVAATGMSTLIKEQVGDQLTDGMGRYTLSQLINDWVHTMIDTSNPFEALATVIANQIFALIISALRPALTDDVYHTLQCIFYCNMASDATFNDAQWAQARSDITAQIGGIAGVFLEHLVYLLGTGGLTNLARAGGSSTGDCSDCDCGDGCFPSWEFFDIDSGTTVSRTSGSWTITPELRGDGHYYVIIQGATDSDCCILGSFTTDSGTVEFTYYNPCGEDRADIVMGLHPGSVLGHDANAFLFKSSVTFEVTITSA